MAELVKQESRREVARPELTRETTTYTPRADILETAEELLLYVDMPGVKPDDLDVRYENRELTIHGKVAPRHGKVNYLLCEYGIGDFYRSFSIGESIDAEKISAELQDGVLVLHLPKSEAAKPKRITVKA